MAERRPLVVADGVVKELSDDDTLLITAIKKVLANATQFGINTQAIVPIAQVDIRGIGDLLNCSNGADQDFKVNISEVGAAIKRALLTSSTPTKMQIGNNGGVGIEINETNSIIKILQQLQIAGGTPGVGKVLTSDVNGLASWANLGGATILTNYSGGTFSTISTTPAVVTGFTFAVEANKKYQVFINGNLRSTSASYSVVLGLQTPTIDYYLRGWKIVETTINTLGYENIYVGGGSTNNSITATNTTSNPPKSLFCCFTLITGTTGGNVSLSLHTQDPSATAYLSSYTMTLIG